MKYELEELPGIEIYRHDDGKVFVSGENAYGKKYEIEYEIVIIGVSKNGIFLRFKASLISL